MLMQMLMMPLQLLIEDDDATPSFLLKMMTMMPLQLLAEVDDDDATSTSC